MIGEYTRLEDNIGDIGKGPRTAKGPQSMDGTAQKSKFHYQVLYTL